MACSDPTHNLRSVVSRANGHYYMSDWRVVWLVHDKGGLGLILPMNRIIIGLLRLFTTLAMLASCGSTFAEDIFWSNPNGGSWNEPSNWLPNRVPGPGDDVQIVISGTYTVTMTADVSVQSLTLGGPVGKQTLDAGGRALTLGAASQVGTNGILNQSGNNWSVPGGLTVAGEWDWSAGVVQGVVNIATNGVWNITGSNPHDLPLTEVTNLGTMVWNAGSIRGGGATGTLIINQGLWDIQSDWDINSAYGYNSVVITNLGRMQKSGGAVGSSTWMTAGVSFVNQGVVDLMAGTFAPYGPGDNSGQMIVEAGAILLIDSPGFTFDAGGSISGAGTLQATGGGWTLNCSLDVGTTLLQGGDLSSQTGIFNDDVEWTGGRIVSSSLAISTNGVLKILDGPNHDLPNTALENRGTIIWATGNIRGGGGVGTQLINRGLVDIQADGVFNADYGYNSFVISNFNTVRKSFGLDGLSTEIRGGVNLVNAGVMDIKVGVLRISGSGENSGRMDVAAGTTLYLSPSPGYTMDAGSVLDGAGTVVMAGGNLTMNCSLDVAITQLQGGDLYSQSGIFNSHVVWTTGRVVSSSLLTISTNGSLTISGDNDHDLPNTTLENYGTVTWLGGGRLRGGGGAGTEFINHGLWDIESDQVFNADYGYNSVVIRNLGRLRKSSGAAGTATTFGDGVGFFNSGTVDVEAGNLNLNFGLQAVSGTIGGVGSVNANAGGFQFESGVVLSNVVMNGGNLVGTNVISGRVSWLGGIWNGATVVVANDGILSIDGTADHDLANGSLVNNGKVVWTGGRIRGGAGGTMIANTGLWDTQTDQVVNADYCCGGVQFNNTGIFRKSGGGGSTVFGGNVFFNNTAQVDVATGVIVFAGGVSSSGGTFGPGQVQLTAGTFQLADGAVVKDGVFNGATPTGTNLLIGHFSWLNGVWNNQVVNIATNGVLEIAGGADHDLANGVVTNWGNVKWTGGRIRGGASGTTVVNYGLWDAQLDQVFNADYCCGGVLFDNLGVFRKSGGTGSTAFGGGVFFVNASRMDVAAGSVVFAGGVSSSGGTFGPGQIQLTGGTFLFSDGAVATDAVINGALPAAGNVLAGHYSWVNGTWNNSTVNIPTNGVLEIAGGLDHDLANGTITNLGTVKWTGGRLRGGASGTTIFNSGLWDVQSDQVFNADYCCNGVQFVNTGILRKSAGSGSTVFTPGIALVNTGVLELESGALSLGAGYDLSTGTIEFVLHGQSQFGQLSLPGNAVIAGALNVTLADAFVPTVGSVFPLINYSSGSGSFVPVDLPENGLTWQLAYNPNAVVLSLADNAGPSIVSQPSSQTVLLGTPASLGVNVSGPGPVIYQWLHNGNPVGNGGTISGANSATLAISGVGFTDAGTYVAYLTNSLGAASTLPITLTVTNTGCVAPPAGLVHWWPGSGYLDDIVGGKNASLVGSAAYVPGLVGQAFGVGSGGYVDVPGTSGTNFFGTNNFTILVAANFSATPGGSLAAPGAVLLGQDEGGGNVNKWIWGVGGGQMFLHLNGPGTGPVWIGTVPFNPVPNQWYQLALTRSGSNFTFYANGAPIGTGSSTLAIPTVNADLHFGEAEGFGQVGALDEIQFMNRALTPAEALVLYQTGPNGVCLPPPVIVSQPANGTNAAGTTATFSVTAAGVEPLGYRWLFNGAPIADGGNISGSGTATLSIGNCQLNSVGGYSVMVSNALGTTNSAVASLTVPDVTIGDFINGDFEQPGGAIRTQIVGNFAPGWSSGGGGFDIYESSGADGIAAFSGNNYVSFGHNGSTGGSVFQTFKTLTGQTYVVDYRLSQQQGIDNNQQVTVTATSAGVMLGEVTTPIVVPNDGVWIAGTPLRFTATSAITTLTFLDSSPAGVGGGANWTLDDVVVTALNATDCVPAPGGLLGWWKADGDAVDVIGGNNGQLRGGAGFVSGEVGQAFNLDGNSAWVEVPDPTGAYSPTGPFSVECWIKASSQQSYPLVLVVDKSHGFADNTGWAFQTGTDGTVAFFYGLGGGGAPLNFAGPSSTTKILDDRWHHLAGAWTGSHIQIYVDGVLENSLVQTTPPVGNNRDLEIGSAWGGGSRTRYFHGLIDEVSIYNRALSPAEVLAIHDAGAAGKCTPPPIVLGEPQSAVTAAGGSLSFAVTVTGVPPLSYQWYFKGNALADSANLTGSHAATLAIGPAMFNNAGEYALVASNYFGSVTSTVARLTVTNTTCAVPPSGLVAWWPANGDTADVVGGINGVLAHGAGYMFGEVGQAFAFGGNGAAVSLGAAPGLQLQDFTLEAWVQRSSADHTTSDAAPNGGDALLLAFGSQGYGFGLHADGTLYLSKVGVNAVSSGAAISDTNLHHVALTKTGTTVVFFVDGAAYSAPPYAEQFSFTSAAAIGAQGDLVNGSKDGSFFGSIDELGVYNRALTVQEVQSIYDSGSAGKCTQVPNILTGPSALTNFIGATSVFSVAATGQLPIHYQWYFNTQPLSDSAHITGASSNTLTILNSQLSDAGSYSVVVMNGVGQANTDPVTLTILRDVPVFAWPQPTAIVYGTPLSAAVFNANASVPGTFAYTPQAGVVLDAGTQTLNVVFTPTNSAQYSSVTGSVSLVVSRAPLTVTANDATRAFGHGNPIFAGTVVGLVNGDSIGATYGSGATATSPPGTYTIVPALQDPGNRAGNYNVSLVSGMLTVTAGPPPTLSAIAPKAGPTNGGTTVALIGSGFETGATVSFGGVPAAGVAILGPTSLSCQTPPAPKGTVDVLVSNPDGTIVQLANAFTYGVAPTIQTDVTSLTVNQGGAAHFSAQVTGDATLSFQWQFNGIDLTDDGRVTGSRSTALSIANVGPNDAGRYRLTIGNPFGTALSAAGVLSVITPPTILVPPSPVAVGIGGLGLFSVSANGTAPLTYQWLRNGSPVGTDAPILQILNAQSTNQGNYSVVVSNPAGSVTSAPVSLTLLGYCAVAQVAQSTYPMNVGIPFTIKTFDCGSSAPVPNAGAVLWIFKAGTTRTIPVTTDSTGSATVTFNPLRGETGECAFGVALPGQPAPVRTGHFTIEGLAISPDNVSLNLLVGTYQTNAVTLTNLTGIDLTGIKATFLGLPANLTAETTLSDTLLGNATSQLTYVLGANGAVPSGARLGLQITTLSGVTNTITINVSITAPKAYLVATPDTLIGTMVNGQQSFVSFTVANNGGAPSGDINLQLPGSAPWMSVVTPLPIPSLAPGESNTVALALTPSTNLTLGAYPGTITVYGTNTQVLVPFQIDDVSVLKGSLAVTVQDQLSIFGAGNPNVSNAVVTISDVLTGTNVFSVTTDTSGIATFTNLTSAYYNVAVQATNHGSFKTTFLVEANQTNNLVAFLPINLVNYSWSVVPTQIQDNYDFKLITVFQTQVPWPVLVVEPGAINLCDIVGDVAQINLTITNHGLIKAQGLKLNIATNANWSIVPLVTDLGDLEAESTILVPCTITRIGADTNAPSNIGAEVDWFVETPTQKVYNATPIFIYNANPLDCGHSSTPVVVLAGGGASGGGCCGGGGDSGGGGYGGIGGSGSSGFSPSSPIVTPPTYNVYVPGAVVQVTLEIDQSAVVTRNAFKATLNLSNGAEQSISDLSVTINPADSAGSPATNSFFIQSPFLTGIGAVNGTGTMAPGASGQATWTIIPTRTAAPNGPVRYAIGGTLSYTLDGEKVVIPLFPVPITVLPDPRLAVDYFLEHNVYSDDPFTDPIEPAIPYGLGILVKNNGLGVANNFTITSAQPKIIDNRNGLAIAFQLIDSQAGTNQTLSPSLTIGLGDIGTNQAAVGIWYMVSTLEGSFISYDASFHHTDALGGTNTSIVDSVKIHGMSHIVRLTGSLDDMVPDFLAIDSTNMDALPNNVYSSDGAVYPVSALTNLVASGAPDLFHPEVTVKVPPTNGWTYMEIIDPGDGLLTVGSVKREDGSELLVGPNVWQTPQRLHMVPPQNQNLIHIFDNNPGGTYTINYHVPPKPPTATTLNPIVVTAFKATLQGQVNPDGAATTVYFEYGPTTNYGSLSGTNIFATQLTSLQVAQLDIYGLVPNTTNHYRFVAVNSEGTTYGADQTLVSQAAAPFATTLPAYNIEEGSATLSGSINPNGAPTSVFFEWGGTTNYGHLSATNIISSLLNFDQVVWMGVTGMTPDITNHFRVVAFNTVGTTVGDDYPFPPWPTLGTAKAKLAPHDITLFWPTNYPGYSLEFTTNLLAPVIWSPFPGAVGVVNGHYTTTNNPALDSIYYRLTQ